jgi:hypothetical protein
METPQAMDERGWIHRCVAWVVAEVGGAELRRWKGRNPMKPPPIFVWPLCRGHDVFRCRGRSSAPVDLFVFAAPPRRCPLLYFVLGHRRAAEMVASDDDRKKINSN